MKKFFLFSVMALVALATGCSKSDDGGSPKKLVGTWEFVRIDVDYSNIKGCYDEATFTETQLTTISFEDTDCAQKFEKSKNYFVSRDVLNIDGTKESILKLNSTELVTRSVDATEYWRKKIDNGRSDIVGKWELIKLEKNYNLCRNKVTLLPDNTLKTLKYNTRCVIENEKSGRYSVNGSEITLTYSDEETIMTIGKLTDTELSLTEKLVDGRVLTFHLKKVN